MQFSDVPFSFVEANLNILLVASFNLHNSLLVLILYLCLHLTHGLLGLSPQTNLEINHVLTCLLRIPSVTVDLSVALLHYPVQMSDLVLKFCNFVLGMDQCLAETLTSLHSVFILLLFLVKVLSHALA